MPPKTTEWRYAKLRNEFTPQLACCWTLFTSALFCIKKLTTSFRTRSTFFGATRLRCDLKKTKRTKTVGTMSTKHNEHNAHIAQAIHVKVQRSDRQAIETRRKIWNQRRKIHARWRTPRTPRSPQKIAIGKTLANIAKSGHSQRFCKDQKIMKHLHCWHMRCLPEEGKRAANTLPYETCGKRASALIWAKPPEKPWNLLTLSERREKRSGGKVVAAPRSYW